MIVSYRGRERGVKESRVVTTVVRCPFQHREAVRRLKNMMLVGRTIR